MAKIRVLHIGIKNWPYDSIFKDTSLKKKGGGVNKYFHLLINALPDEIHNIIITQYTQGLKRKETIGNNTVYRLTPWNLGRKFSQVIFNIKAFFKASRLLKNGEVDVIHGHMLIGILFSMILKKIYNVPVVGAPYSIYTKEFGFPLINLARYVERNVYSSLDVLIFETEENRKRAKEIINTEYSNSKVILMGMDLPKDRSVFYPVEAYADKKLSIIFIGRIVNIKALDRLISGISLMDDFHKSRIIIDIIGEGEESEKLQRMIRDYKLENTVFLRGFVENIEEYLANSDMFINPSFMEGTSIALLEGMSYGLACIINDWGFPFVDHVYVMKNNSPEIIAQTLSIFIDDCGLINYYKKQSIDLIGTEFSLERFADQYVDVYRMCDAAKA
ncbi:MAG: glycosyltransferase family 4 protein [Bacteroidales bacterium]|nr:glycosyltransferase family 4 protein [Bacteroidales bacterium]